jgi:hypothetical protein
MQDAVITIPFILGQMRSCANQHESENDTPTYYTYRRINQLLENYWRAVAMRKHTERKFPDPKNSQLVYINKKLTAEQKDEFEVWFKDNQVVDQAFTRAMHEGHKFSFMENFDGGVYNGLMYSAKDDPINGGYALSSKSSNWYKAVCMSVYKHYVLTKGDWKVLLEAEEEEG